MHYCRINLKHFMNFHAKKDYSSFGKTLTDGIAWTNCSQLFDKKLMLSSTDAHQLSRSQSTKVHGCGSESLHVQAWAPTAKITKSFIFIFRFFYFNSGWNSEGNSLYTVYCPYSLFLIYVYSIVKSNFSHRKNFEVI